MDQSDLLDLMIFQGFQGLKIPFLKDIFEINVSFLRMQNLHKLLNTECENINKDI